jgi:dihydroflavonol-4-reductase
MTKPTVLVTGATGFIAKYCIAELLNAGYPVRGTVRRLDRADDVRRAVKRAGADPQHLTFVTADLESDTGWDLAAAGCRYVLHTASPFPVEQPDNNDALVKPARDGTLRVLNAAAKAGLKRVVLTSSAVAIMYASGHPNGLTFTETDWTDESRSDITPYIASKTRAEKAAWDFTKSNTNAPELAVINPTFVQGPGLDPDLSTSLEVIRLMGVGAYPAAPRITFPVCDVRDVARAHVLALENPKAAGERFIVVSGHLPLIGLGRLMVEALPDLKKKAPKFELPDIAVRGLALFDKRLRTVLPELGAVRQASGEKAKTVLGLEPRSAEDAVRDAARSLRELKVI